MRRLALAALALAGVVAVRVPASAQDRPLVLVHGFKSNGATWTEAANRLRVQLAVTTYAPSLNWKEDFPRQASELNGKLPGVPGLPFAVGHSNGGVAVREWSKIRPLSGIVTLSSPNNGAPIANNAVAFIRYNTQIVSESFNLRLAFSNPNQGTFWVWNVIQGVLAFVTDNYNLASLVLGAGGLDVANSAFTQIRVGSPYMRDLNSDANTQREINSLPPGRRAAIVTSVPDYHLGGPFRASWPDDADAWRVGLYTSIGVLDSWAAYLLATGDLTDLERAQRMLYVSFLLSLYETMWCQTVSDATPYAVSLAGECHPNDTVIPSWSHNLRAALSVPKPNMPPHVQQTYLMTPVLYEVLTAHMGLAPRGGPVGGSELRGGQELAAGQSLWSPDLRYRLVYQVDGNLVIYNAGGIPVWWTGTAGTTPGRAVMQTDGNFVTYAAAGNATWHTHTFGNPGAYLRMQNNGSIVVYRHPDNARLWSSPVPANEVDPPPPPPPAPGRDTLTPGARLYAGQAATSLDGRFSLTYQTDGNLVLYGPGGVPRWSAHVFSSPGYVEMQVDGNFVAYASNGVPTWASHTSGVLNARLVVHNDGNVAIYSPGNLVVWSTGTGGS